MLRPHLRRGTIAGAVAGVFYGAFALLVGENMVALAEGLETGTHGTDGGTLAAGATVTGSVLWGVLLGVVVFGIAYYFLEPAIPGPQEVRSYVLGAAAFVTVSGAPWIILPPQPPGVEAALPTRTRMLWYGGMVLLGAVACGLSGVAFTRLRTRGRVIALAAAACPLIVFAVPLALAPPNPTTTSAPPELVAAFRWMVAFGQASLWIVMASAHAALTSRATGGASDRVEEIVRAEPH